MNLPQNKQGFYDAVGLPEFLSEGVDSRKKQLAEWAEMQKGEGPEEDEQATQQRDQQRQQQAEQLAQQVQPGHGQQLPALPQLPPVMKSSIPVDPDAEDHVAEALEMFRILNSPEGMKVKGTLDLDAGQPGSTSAAEGSKRTGLAIWTDGKLHMLAHIAAGKAKGLIFPPPIGGPPPMPAMPPKGGPAGASAAASPLTPPPPGALAATSGGQNVSLPA
jgi:hypothetical protein